MKLINSTLLALTLVGWFLFFISIWEMSSYWVVAIWFLTMIAITTGYVLTKPSSIKTMTEEEPEHFIEYIDEPVDWQECYKVAKDSELDKEVDKIIEELRGHQDVG